jgi:hypothetical protein
MVLVNVTMSLALLARCYDEGTNEGTMGVTVTLDDDVLEKVKAESEARGLSVDGTVNEVLRSTLAAPKAAAEAPFVIKTFNSGPPRFNLDCTARLLEEIEGPDWR